jgi:hypothetical protein
MREFSDTVVYPEAQAREEDGKRVSQDVLDKMACVLQQPYAGVVLKRLR